MYSCTHWLNPATSLLPPHLGSYTRELLVSQDRRHIFVIPWFLRIRNLCRKEESEQAIKRSGGEGGEGVKLELILEESEDETDTQAVVDYNTHKYTSSQREVGLRNCRQTKYKAL